MKTRGRSENPALALLAWAAAVVLLGVMTWILAEVLRMGWGNLSFSFLTGEVANSGRAGGVGPVIVSTFWILLVSLLVTAPLGMGCALWLTEFARRGGRLFRLVNAAVDLLASVPSIVFGLFGMVFFCELLDLGFSILSGGLTLGCMVLPVVMKTTLASFQSISSEYRQGAAALGLSRTTAILRIYLPVASPGVVAGLTLGVGRALSETAALLFTSGYATRWPESVMDSGRALSVHIYDLAMNVPQGSANASASALVLFVLLFMINSTAVTLSERWRKRCSHA